MATRTFTSDFSFTGTSADSLLQALRKDVMLKIVEVSDVTQVSDPQEIKAFFGVE